ncbi:MAG: TonB-dependent receptor [Sphingomonas sp.]
MAALAVATPAWAQTAVGASDAQQDATDQQVQGTSAPADATGNEIVVTGVRASIQSAQAIKRNASQIVDSVVAEDIGKLPDRNVAEALQRITGVQIQDSYGEGSSVAIRGLTQVRTELNGRDIFTADASSPRLSLEDIPSELLAGIDVYKNPSADRIEDQLAGTIDFRTRKPFDFDGFRMGATVTNTYYDLVRKSRPSASILLSDRWNTGIGEIGVLADVAYQKTAFRQDTISTEPFYTLDQSLKADGSPNNPDDYATATELGRLGQVTTLPHGTGIGEVYGDRRRLGTDLAIQWKPSDTLEFTGEMFRNDYKFRFDDYSYFAYTSGSSISPQPGAPFTYADNGDFVSGTFQNLPIGNNTSLDTRHSTTTDYSLAAKWRPSSNLTVDADFQFVDSTTHDLRSIIGLTGTATTLTQDISGTLPTFQITSAAGLTNPATYTNGFYLDDLNHSKGTEKAGRLDAEYKFDGGLLSSIKAGFRYADRYARTSDTGYRYTGLTGTPTDLEYVSLSNFFRGQTPLFGNALFFSRQTTLDYDQTRAELGVDTLPSYLPSGTNQESIKTYAGYGEASFDASGMSIPLDGNIGLRVVRTEQAVSGFYQQTNLITHADGTQETGETTFNPIAATDNYTSFLPSVNLRFHFTHNLQLRFAYSKNISRPEFNQLNPSLTITEPGTEQINQEHDTSGGNPYLKPMTSNNLDASLEWYFSRSGSLTAAAFYKDISNYIQTAITARDVTFQDGVTATYNVTSYNNVSDAKVKGFEVGYQQFFDFLPGLLSGFGVQANFTYVDSNAPSPATEGPVKDVPLELLSKYNYNLIGIYEKGKFSARVAYNWRSKYLVTTSGNGSGNLPVFDKPYGQLDASISYDVTPHFGLSLDAVNLTDSLRQTYYGIDTRPRDSILNDRRLSITAKVSF